MNQGELGHGVSNGGLGGVTVMPDVVDVGSSLCT
jgi:hypothetical protein